MHQRPNPPDRRPAPAEPRRGRGKHRSASVIAAVAITTGMIATTASSGAATGEPSLSTPAEDPVRHAVWDLGQPIQTWGPEVRVDLNRTLPVSAVELTWAGTPPSSLRVEVSTDVYDADRTVVADNVEVTGDQPIKVEFDATVDARYVAVVLADAAAAGTVDQLIVLPEQSEPEVLADVDFESDTAGDVPDGWAVDGPAETVTVQPDPAGDGQALRFVNRAGTQAWTRLDLQPTFNDLVVSYRVRAEQTTDSQGFLLGPGGSGLSGAAALVTVETFSNGQWRINDGGTAVNVGPYQAQQWYDVELHVRQLAGTWDMYIDDELVVDGATVRSAPSGDGTGAVFLNGWTNNSGTVHYDDLRVSAEPISGISFDVPAEDGPAYPLLGTVAPRHASEIASSLFSVGGETLDRDYTDYDAYRDYLGPLGAKSIRLQAGWAKTEQEPGVYDFGWLDHIIDDAVSQGVRPWLNVSYGNGIYPGGGGGDLGGVLPNSSEALAAWDAWVEALVTRYGDRVHEWEVWNEPDASTPASQYADFYLRTAAIIRDVQPEASIIAIAGTGGVLNNSYVEDFLDVVRDAGSLDLVDEISYHPYNPNPDASYNAVANLRSRIGTYADHITIRQGENGAPSENVPNFALRNLPWAELSQAKWDTRRLLGDFARDIPTSIFQMSDMRYRGGRWNPKGLLLTDPDDLSIIRPKEAYRAVQTVTAVFDDRLSAADRWELAVDGSRTTSTWAYERTDGQVLGVSWYSNTMPSNSISTDLATWTVTGDGPEVPALIDIRTGRVYGVPDSSVTETADGMTFTAPLYDSPVALVDMSLVGELVDMAHGDFVRHVTALAKRLQSDGAITPRERSALVRAAARSQEL